MQLRTETSGLQHALDISHARAHEAQAKEEAATEQLSACRMEHASVCGDLRQHAANLQSELQTKNEADKSDMARAHRYTVQGFTGFSFRGLGVSF